MDSEKASTRNTNITIPELVATTEAVNKVSQTSPSSTTFVTLPASKKTKPHVTIETVFEDDNLEKSMPVEAPKDTGRVAITMMIASLFLDGSTFGNLLAYGIFQDYYQTKFTDPNTASWIGALAQGVSYLGAPLVTWCCQRYSLPPTFYIRIGFALCVLSLLVSAFITSLPGLIFTQGLLYGTGSLFVSVPELIVLNTWFDKRRGLAYGIVFAGCDIFGVAYTLLTSVLLNKYGFRITMVILAALTFVCAGTPLLYYRPRVEPTQSNKPTNDNIPFSPSSTRRNSLPNTVPDKPYHQRAIFYLFTTINFLQSLAWCLPFIYLPSFVTSLGHSSHSAATVLAVGNFSMILGDLSFGKLSDKVHVNILIITSTAVSAAVTFILWGFVGSGTNNLAAIIAFSFLFGCFGGGYLALWARMGTLFGEKDAHMVYSTLCTGRGLGVILSGPISQALLKTTPPKMLRPLGQGPYGGVIMFVGMCTAGAAIMGVCAILALWWKKERTLEIEEKSVEGTSEPKLVESVIEQQWTVASVTEQKVAEAKETDARV